MSYRDFALPAANSQMNKTDHWLDWMQQQGEILIPVVPHHRRSCLGCFGASGYRDDGETWPYCWPCRTYGAAVDTFVPATYCVDSGLESMLHRYKDRGVDWLRSPLASLLTKFLEAHADCIDDDARGIDVATITPPNNQGRAFNHLERLIQGVVVGDPILHRFPWVFDAITRERAATRPARGELKPEAYWVDERRVVGASVLLLDDLWTSGSTAASAARALKDAGAVHVTVVTLGRQLTPRRPFGSTTEIYDSRRRAEWSLDECAVCA